MIWHMTDAVNVVSNEYTFPIRQVLDWKVYNSPVISKAGKWESMHYGDNSSG